MDTLLIMLIAHFFGDYLFQPKSLANAKKDKLRWLLVHALLYTAAMSLLFVCAQWTAVLKPLALIAGTHLAIDQIKIEVEQGCDDKKDALKLLICFCADQLMHILIILICWFVFVRNAQPTTSLETLNSISTIRTGLVHLVIFAVIWNPTSLLIKKVFCLFPSKQNGKGKSGKTGELKGTVDLKGTTELKGTAELNGTGELNGTAELKGTVDLKDTEDTKATGESEDNVPAKAGEWIGKLERVIVAALVLGGAVSSIAFVLTAKSVARFKQFEDEGFTERYLVGTLLSVSIALITALIGSALLK